MPSAINTKMLMSRITQRLDHGGMHERENTEMLQSNIERLCDSNNLPCQTASIMNVFHAGQHVTWSHSCTFDMKVVP